MLKGYRTINYGADVIGEITGEKPQSKLWYNDAGWWGIMWDRTSLEFKISKFNTGTQGWVLSNTVIDDRDNVISDALWDEDNDKLYVLTHVFEAVARTVTDP